MSKKKDGKCGEVLLLIAVPWLVIACIMDFNIPILAVSGGFAVLGLVSAISSLW
jgi:hypothetical protein